MHAAKIKETANLFFNKLGYIMPEDILTNPGHLAQFSRGNAVANTLRIEELETRLAKIDKNIKGIAITRLTEIKAASPEAFATPEE